MKVFNKLASALMVLPMLAALTACNETADYTPGVSDPAKYEIPRFVSFSAEDLANGNFELEEGESNFMVTLQRDSTAGELTVGLAIEQTTEGALSIPESVTFPDEVDEVSFSVSYDAAAILAKGGMSDTVSIKIVSDDFTPDFTSGEYKFIARLFPMTPWCSTAEEFAAAGGQGDFPFAKGNTGVYTYTQFANGDQDGLRVAFRQNTQNPNSVQFKIIDWGKGVFATGGQEIVLPGTWDKDKGIYRVSFPETFTGYNHPTYGSVYVSDVVEYTGSTWEQHPSDYDPETGLFTLNVIYYVSAGYFGYGNEYLQMDGYKPYEANLADDFEWKAKYDGVFQSSQMRLEKSTTLYEGICVTTTDNCDSTFLADYGTAYKLEAPYVSGYDIYFCVNEEGAITLAPGFEEPQPLGFGAVGAAVYASINTGASSLVGKKLTLNITFVNADASIEYGTANEVFSATSWKSLGMGLYTDDVVGPRFSADPISYEVEIQENEDVAGHYRLVNAYGEAFPYNDEGDWDSSKDYYLEIHAENPAEVYIPLQELGLDWGYGMFSIWSLADYNGTQYGTLENGVITFPTQSLLVSMAEYDDGGFYYANRNGAFRVELPSASGAKTFSGVQPAKAPRKVGSTAKKASKKYSMNVNWKGRHVGNRLNQKTLKTSF